MAKTKGKTANFFVWIILGLLIIGLAGFGVDGFGGSVRSIGQVGDREIRVNDYFRALQQEIRAAEAERGGSIPFSEAQQMGLDQTVRARLVTVAALENETMRLGLSVGDDVVAEEILGISSFRGVDGTFSRETYRFALQNEGLSESEFEEQVRIETARGILQAALTSGVPAPAVYADTINAYLSEQRSFSVALLEPARLDDPVAAPDDADLQAYYEENPQEFTEPGFRRMTYAWITPEQLYDDIEIEEELLRDLYDQRSDEFDRPERRLVERLIFSTPDEAQDALDRIESGAADFADVVQERGLSLDDVDMGDVTPSDLSAAARDEVFALEGPGITGPFETPFGPALFRVNAVLSAQTIPFEEVREDLRVDLARDRARRIIADRYDDFEDLLAGGATLEDLARETEMNLGEIAYRDDSRDGIAGYEAFREAADALSDGDFPEVIALEDGGLFALRLDEEVPARLRDFNDVVVQVIEAWEVAEIQRRLATLGEDLSAQLEAGATFEDLDLPADSVEAITRNGFVQGIPRALIAEAFTLASEGTTRVVQAEGQVYLIRLDEILPPDADTPETEQLRAAISEQLRQSIAQDLFSYYARRLESDAGIQLNDAAIQAVHQNFR